MKYQEFYEQFLTIEEPGKNGPIGVHCVFHDDQKKSAMVDLETGVFHCEKCQVSYSPARFLAEKNDIPIKEALIAVRAYLEERNYSVDETGNFSKSPTLKNFLPLFEDAGKNPYPDWAEEYAVSRGFSLEVMKEASVGFLPGRYTHWKRDSLVFPYFSNGRCVGISYRDREGNKGVEKGSHLTLWGLESLTDEDEVVIGTEGESDRLMMMQIVKDYGLNVKVVSAHGISFRQEWAREFEGIKHVIWILQSDEAALKQEENIKRVLGRKAVCLHLKWKRGQFGKDLCDWCVYNNPRNLVDDIVGELSLATRRRILNGYEFREMTQKPREYVIDNLIAKQQLVLIGASPKSRKTWLMLNIARVLMLPGDCLFSYPDFKSLCSDRKILFVEEEGDIKELEERISLTWPDGWENRVHIAHRLGISLQDSNDVAYITNRIETEGITDLFLDPMQRLHSGDENSAEDLGPLFKVLHGWLNRFPDLVIYIIHHFKRNASIEQYWEALRGSSRTAGEVDLGIFIEKGPISEGEPTKLTFSGRTIRELISPTGSSIWTLKFKDGLFTVDDTKPILRKAEALLEEMKTRDSWAVNEAASHFKVTGQTIRNWVERKLKDDLEITAPKAGEPVVIRWIKDSS